MRRESARLFEELGEHINPRALMRHLSVAQIQLVEIVKAISLSANTIIMDEPTSAITEKEVEVLLKQINKLKAQGVAIIYISPNGGIFRIADTITVLRDGQLVGSDSAQKSGSGQTHLDDGRQANFRTVPERAPSGWRRPPGSEEYHPGASGSKT